MTVASASAASDIGDRVRGAEDQAKAFINILEDFADEKLRLRESQAAALNILEDFNEERRRSELLQKAALNILDDFGVEKSHLENVQKAIFNIFDDLHAEKNLLESAQAGLVRSGQQFQASLREKEVLLQEVHHRVKNNLQVISSLINMQMRKLSDTKSREALEECQNRVLAIALIHEKLYQSKNYANVPFSDYARSLAAGIFHATGVSAGNVELSLEFENLSLAVDKAIPCGLILNELITNALKHAFPNDRRGTLRIEMRTFGVAELELVVADNGIGIDAHFDIAKSKSLGMQLVTTLVEQLDGELQILRNAGTTFRIRFPLEASA